jgi:cell division ATPase FtsA
MINKPVTITGLDIGSSKISAVALELSGAGHHTVLAHEIQPSRGLYRGTFSDMAEASNSVGRVLKRLSEKIGRRPDNIYANISGDSLRGERSKGMIPLSSRGREVTASDISRCVNAASTIRLTFDREIVHRIVSSFSIDDQPSIRNALGLYASRLYCEMYMITANLNHIQNIHKCVNDAGYDVKELVYSGIADGMSLLEDAAKEDGVILLDMGHSLTELSVFSSGALTFMEIISIGAADTKGALKDDAAFGTLTLRIRSVIDDLSKKGVALKSAVITGDLSLSEGAAEALEERLGLPVRMGSVKGVHGNISGAESLRAATAIGLARYACLQYQPKSAQAKRLARSISDKVIEIFNNYF